ncbi:MAG TPA: hypothetical protein VHM70_24155 [Polyangiaceae bacterium]|jgi:hypothetical protein|nr:hypothetical protein [Polyangiaceae bacterium]
MIAVQWGVLACHALPEGERQQSTATTGAPQVWAPERLCVTGVQIFNQSVGAGEVVGVGLPSADQAREQVVALGTREQPLSYRQVWQLILSDTQLGSYELFNPNRPFNRLSVSLKATGLHPQEGQEEFSTAEALAWIVRRAGKIRSDEDFGDVWFEFVPVTNPDVSLEVATQSPHGLSLTARVAGEDTPPNKLWGLLPTPLCDL